MHAAARPDKRSGLFVIHKQMKILLRLEIRIIVVTVFGFPEFQHRKADIGQLVSGYLRPRWCYALLVSLVAFV
jgi:hypothetical protein